MRTSKAAIPFFAICGLLGSAGAAPAVTQERDLLLPLNTTAPFVDTQALSSMPVTYANGSNITLGEEQPDDFMCTVQYKPRGIPLHSIDVMLNFVTALTELALLQWGQIQESFSHDFAALRVRFLSTRAPGKPKLATKEVMWSLRVISNFMHENKQGYGEINFQPQYDGSESLGFAQLLKLPSPRPPGGAASDVAVTKRADIDDGIPSDNDLIQIPDSVTPRVSNDAAQIVDLKVYKNGERFDPYMIYSILMNINVAMAEEDDKDKSSPGVQGFDLQREWQVGFAAIVEEGEGSLTHRTIIEATGDLAQCLATITPAEYRWRESSFKIRVDGKIVGTGFIHHASR